MSLAALVARPAFAWNHNALICEVAEGLADRLDAELALPSSGPRAGQAVQAPRLGLTPGRAAGACRCAVVTAHLATH
jgi:hypothetical protein